MTRTIGERGTLKVLCSPHPASNFFRRDGEGFTGLDHDVMQKFARSLGVDLEVVAIDSFDRLIPALLAGEGDVIASSFSITPERARSASFSTGYFPVLMMITTRKDSTVASEADLEGLTALSVKGSSQEARLGQIPGVAIEHRPRTPEIYRSLAAGEGDFAVFDSSSVVAQLPNYPGLKIAFQLPDRQYYGFAVAPGSDLVGPLNAHIEALQRGGLLFGLIQRYLGDRAADIYRLASE